MNGRFKASGGAVGGGLLVAGTTSDAGEERGDGGHLPLAGPAGRAGGAVQGPEHVAELVRHARGRGDRTGPGDAGRRGAGGADRADEPGPAQARQRPQQPGGAAGEAGGRAQRQGLSRRAPGAVARHGHRLPGGAAAYPRRGDLRGRRQPRRDQSAAYRHREHGPRAGRPDPGGGGRRHRPRRRLRLLLRHHRAAVQGGPGPGRRVPRQQVPGRCDAPGAGPRHAARPHRTADAGRAALLPRPRYRRGGRPAGVAARRGPRERGGAPHGAEVLRVAVCAVP